MLRIGERGAFARLRVPEAEPGASRTRSCWEFQTDTVYTLFLLQEAFAFHVEVNLIVELFCRPNTAVSPLSGSRKERRCVSSPKTESNLAR